MRELAGVLSGGQPSARIGMCKWPTFCDRWMLLVNAESFRSSMIGRPCAPTICPDDMSLSSRSDDLRFFESRVLRLEISRVVRQASLPAESQPPRRTVARILLH